MAIFWVSSFQTQLSNLVLPMCFFLNKVTQNGWFMSWKIPNEMDDDWGYPHCFEHHSGAAFHHLIETSPGLSLGTLIHEATAASQPLREPHREVVGGQGRGELGRCEDGLEKAGKNREK